MLHLVATFLLSWLLGFLLLISVAARDIPNLNYRHVVLTAAITALLATVVTFFVGTM